MHKRKVDLHELEGEHVMLFISGIDNIAPVIEETKLNELIESFISDRGNKIKCKILWIPIMDHSMQHTNMFKPFLEWYYLVCHTKVLKTSKGEERNFKGWYSVGDTTRISNEVKKFFRDDWNYVGEPIIVVLDAQGKVVNLNAIHMLYTFGDVGFPFTREMEAELIRNTNFRRVVEFLIKPAIVGSVQLYKDWKERGELIFMYGGEEIEWIRSLRSAVDEVARECHRDTIKTVYVGRRHKLELVGRVMNDEKHTRHYCLSDPILLWFFWKRLESFVHLFVQAGMIGYPNHKKVQMLVNYDKSNVGWCLLIRGGASMWYYPMHGKVMLCALRDNNFRRDSASSSMFDLVSFIDCYLDHYKKIEPCWRVELPSTALINNAPPPQSTDQCTDPWLISYCTRKMEKYTTFVCYHGHHAPTPTSPGEDQHH